MYYENEMRNQFGGSPKEAQVDDCGQQRVKMVKRRLWFSECHVVEAEGIRGGLALLWRAREEVEIKGST